MTRPSAYLDHAATTPMLPEAIEAMTEQLRHAGNASSLHATGRRARRVVEESREAIADALGARPSEVVFTSGGTEADNLAIKGLYWSRRPRRRVLISAVEHHAALDPAHWLAGSQGAEVELLQVDAHGRVHPDTLRAAIERDPDDVAMVSVMWANNEVGTVQPVHVLAAVAHDHGIPFHTDAVQAIGQLPVSFSASGVDALTMTGHKIGGPMGAGALLLAKGLTPVSVQHGGGQERDVRSGTLDAPAIAGLAAAVTTAVKEQEALSRRLTSLRDELIRRVRDAVPDVVLNGDPDVALDGGPGVVLDGGPDLREADLPDGRQGLAPGSPGRLPGNAHFSFPGCEGDALLMLLDAKGVECSTGSACSAGVAQPSHVLLAMGADAAAARGSLRFTLGHTSTRDDIDRLIEVLPAAVERARRAGLS
ncbi:aminotransferase class V-fold PLP-dependent enzyme [Nonomuraea phyllanthi]|uniref:cysteine desulfurase n=1 Tax=Nonomuraea phyllanthi TaxID=2219224 RepID=A0A5C4WFR6_9ACTN|nr:cysteine desulfurase family protein [Nonomuraea phyllanthi]KAB8193704.1 aminotransferase class V-fold PLP-dependent enzyme [Nonomuraea phyllanthi]QFY12444.1 aminotransferase class V-fold PLP-dependent enzyme [Nonomuraea phyllanthi]